MAVGTWYFLTATVKNDDYIHAYVNGVEEGTPLAFGTAITGYDRMRIGRYATTGYINGIIDEVRIYDVALTVRQILERFYGIE